MTARVNAPCAVHEIQWRTTEAIRCKSKVISAILHLFAWFLGGNGEQVKEGFPYEGLLGIDNCGHYTDVRIVKNSIVT
jgi:hypothetical protein